MRLLLFLLIPLISFSQGPIINSTNNINWFKKSEITKVEKFAKKFNKNILIFFYRPGCEYCTKMKETVLKDNDVINFINSNYLPIPINGVTKDTLIYNNKIYTNQQPIKDVTEGKKRPFPHDLHIHLYKGLKGRAYWPSFVIINNENEIISTIHGYKPKIEFLRLLKKIK